MYVHFVGIFALTKVKIKLSTKRSGFKNKLTSLFCIKEVQKNISLEQEEKLNLTKEERGALIELRTAIRNKKDLFKFFISKDDDKDETEEQKEK